MPALPVSAGPSAGSTRLAAAVLPDGRATVVGVLLAEALVSVPLAARAAFGVIRPVALAVTLLFTLFVLSAVMAAMTTAFRAALNRALREGHALALASVLGAVASALACLAWLPWMRRYPAAFQTMPGEPTTVGYFLVTAVADSLVIALLWAAVFLYPTARRAAREHERALAQARTEAELLRLRAHLEPHFVLNTLNAIAGMVVAEPRTARTMLGALGDLFRDATRDRGSEHHSLGRELQWLERYASLARGRYGDSLRFEWHAGEAARAQRLPRLLLQPVVENAIQHGALRRDGGGTVAVRAYIDATTLVCEVTDDGPGPTAEPRREGARGLALVERRLALEAPGSELVLSRRPEGGARVVLRIAQTAPRL